MTEAVKDKNSELISKRWAHALIELLQDNNEVSKDDVLNELKKGVLNDNITSTLEQVAKEISDAIKALK